MLLDDDEWRLLDRLRAGELGPPAVVVEDDLTRTLVCPITMGGMPGHTLVITRRHAETVFDLTVEEAQALGAAVAAAARAVRDVFRPAGLLVQQHNGIAAYQTVPHVHVHVVPKVPGPYPGPAPPVPVPPDERARLAGELRRRWAPGGSGLLGP
ncbi:MAG TPA: HIT domain-containing protein [Acidimicrobiales bacterium]|nr:HIT domain-containing protein [Acidimicrobiales bacterium]